MRGLSRLAPEEIAGAVLLVIVLAFVALRPAAVTQLFESPYATPAPSGGPARQLLPAPTATPLSRTIEIVRANALRGYSSQSSWRSGTPTERP